LIYNTLNKQLIFVFKKVDRSIRHPNKWKCNIEINYWEE